MNRALLFATVLRHSQWKASERYIYQGLLQQKRFGEKVGIVDRLVLGLVTQLQGKSCHNSNIQIRFAVIFMSDSIENTVLSNTDRYISAWMTHRNFL